MPVELTCRAVSGRSYAATLRADALALLKILGLEHGELSLLLVGDSGIRRLNREFLGKDQTTDVLSFPQIETTLEAKDGRSATTLPDSPPLQLGDVVISIDTARRQARELGQHLSGRIRTLLIHGTLHLLGYDHERSMTAARRMFAREYQLAALMDAGRPQSHVNQARAKAVDSTHPHEAEELRWSPAAMPSPRSKAVKQSRNAQRPS